MSTFSDIWINWTIIPWVGGGQEDIMLVADRVVLLQNTAEQRC